MLLGLLSTGFSVLNLLLRDALREEHQYVHLGQLRPCYIVVGAESMVGIARYDALIIQRFYVVIESAALRHVDKVRPALCVYRDKTRDHKDLGYLGSCRGVSWPEVGEIVRPARLAYSTAWITRHDAVHVHPLDVDPERAVYRHVFKRLARHGFVVPRRHRHNLGKLAAREAIVGAERTIRVASDDALAVQAVQVWIVPISRKDVNEGHRAGGWCYNSCGHSSHRCACGC